MSFTRQSVELVSPFTPDQEAHINGDGDDSKHTAIKVNELEKMSDNFTQKVDTLLTFQDVKYAVQDRSGVRKEILKGVSGSLKSGELCGVLGASGCGKTTLLDFLADRLVTGERSGNVFVNGRLRDSSYKHIASYVPQEDNLYGTMSVRETLNFSAALSLPESMGKEEKSKHTDALLSDLGLSVCADTRIGNVFLKGVSGGQKRRVSIGVEIVTNSRLLFLDEPTSGLDSAAALRIVKLLKKYANSNHVVMATIHQPSSEILPYLDKMMVLHAGRTVYFGPTSELVAHFAALQYPCPQYTNPADFVISLVNTDFEGAAQVSSLSVVDRLVEGYQNCASKRSLDEQLTSLKVAEQAGSNEKDDRAHTNDSGFNVGYYRQFAELSKRNLLDNLRNPGVLWVRLVMYIMLCLMIGTMYLRIGHGQTSTQDRVSILFFINAFLVFMSIAAVPVFIQDRAVFVRERANGWYSVAVYVLSNFVCQLPGIFLIALVSSAIAYPMIGLNSATGRFGLFLLNLFISLVVAESLMIFISSVVPVYIIGLALGAGVYGMFMLTEGFFILVDNLPKYWIWGYYIGFHTYSFEFFMWTEFDSASVDCDRPISSGKCLWNSGQEVLDYYSMGNVKIGNDIAIMVCMAIIYRLFFFFVLKKYHTGKR